MKHLKNKFSYIFIAIISCVMCVLTSCSKNEGSISNKDNNNLAANSISETTEQTVQTVVTRSAVATASKNKDNISKTYILDVGDGGCVIVEI